MIQLSARGIAHGVTEEIVGRVCLAGLPESDRTDAIRVFAAGSVTGESLDGYLAMITSDVIGAQHDGVPAVSQCQTTHMEDGDILSIVPRGLVQSLYRRRSKSNSLFATDRCNSLCLMCSQPPRDVDDSGQTSKLVRIVGLIDPATEELGITGGEPTLLGDGLLRVVAACRDRLPTTSLHILSNGRHFRYGRYSRALGAVSHTDLMVGVPVYSDQGAVHDYVVQAKGSFDETILGLHNLAKAQVPVEIRIVVHRSTYRRLPQLARFIYRNLTFASHVTFMGLEVIGFAKANIESLWIDPMDYASELEDAVTYLATVGMNVSIYNHQLCTLPRELWSQSRRSISDWKMEFAPECDLCTVKGECGGFFAWNLAANRSRGIAAIP
jgi:His-Xaa-Ser system radical SAM maturase HxsC